jgi:hypothetical protein
MQTRRGYIVQAILKEYSRFSRYMSRTSYYIVILKGLCMHLRLMLMWNRYLPTSTGYSGKTLNCYCNVGDTLISYIYVKPDESVIVL